MPFETNYWGESVWTVGADCRIGSRLFARIYWLWLPPFLVTEATTMLCAYSTASVSTEQFSCYQEESEKTMFVLETHVSHVLRDAISHKQANGRALAMADSMRNMLLRHESQVRVLPIVHHLITAFAANRKSNSLPSAVKVAPTIPGINHSGGTKTTTVNNSDLPALPHALSLTLSRLPHPGPTQSISPSRSLSLSLTHTHTQSLIHFWFVGVFWGCWTTSPFTVTTNQPSANNHKFALLCARTRRCVVLCVYLCFGRCRRSMQLSF